MAVVDTGVDHADDGGGGASGPRCPGFASLAAVGVHDRGRVAIHAPEAATGVAGVVAYGIYGECVGLVRQQPAVLQGRRLGDHRVGRKPAVGRGRAMGVAGSGRHGGIDVRRSGQVVHPTRRRSLDVRMHDGDVEIRLGEGDARHAGQRGDGPRGIRADGGFDLQQGPRIVRMILGAHYIQDTSPNCLQSRSLLIGRGSEIELHQKTLQAVFAAQIAVVCIGRHDGVVAAETVTRKSPPQIAVICIDRHVGDVPASVEIVK